MAHQVIRAREPSRSSRGDCEVGVFAPGPVYRSRPNVFAIRPLVACSPFRRAPLQAACMVVALC